MLHSIVQLLLHPSLFARFPSSHSSSNVFSPFPHVGSGMQSGSTVAHASVHSPFVAVLQHTLFVRLHVSPVPQLSCLLLQSAHVHDSPVSQLLLLLHVLIVVPHATQFMLHIPLVHFCVPSGHVVVLRLQLYEQLFRHVSVFMVFPSSQSSP